MDSIGRIMPVVTTTGDSLGVWIVQFADQNWSGFDNLADAEAYRDAYHEALMRMGMGEESMAEYEGGWEW